MLNKEIMSSAQPYEADEHVYAIAKVGHANGVAESSHLAIQSRSSCGSSWANTKRRV
jgi:hypothetical protein